ncbi:hypothetical protein Tco_1075934 [Tanacetum coccineum]
MEKDSEIYRVKKERVKSIYLKAKKESSDDETLTSRSDDEEYAMAVRNFKSSLEERVNLLGNQEKKRSHSDKEMRRKERVTGNVLDAVIQTISLAIVQNHLATKIKRPSLEVLRAISKMTPKTKPTMKLISWLNRQMRDLLEKEVLELNEKIKKLERSKEIDLRVVIESLNVTFDESPPPTKLSPLVDDDVGEEEAIRKNTKIVNTNNEDDESIEVDEIINIKESKNHTLDQVIGNLNQRTLRSQAQNHSLQIKQMEDEIFFNQSKYIKEMLKKFGLEVSQTTIDAIVQWRSSSLRTMKPTPWIALNIDV